MPSGAERQDMAGPPRTLPAEVGGTLLCWPPEDPYTQPWALGAGRNEGRIARRRGGELRRRGRRPP